MRAAEGFAPGLTLLCHGDAAAAELVDERGEVVHRWTLPYAELPGAPPSRAITRSPGARSNCSRTETSSRFTPAAPSACAPTRASCGHAGERFHHDVIALAGGVGLALARTERSWRRCREVWIVDDQFVEFDLATGEPLRSLSLWNALAASPFAELLARLTVREGDANGLAP